MGRNGTSVERPPLIVAVGGGKGGVGKSVVALNLALAMTRLGARVCVVDADLGSANLHTMLGIDHPGQTLQALLDGRVASLSDVCVQTSFDKLSLVPGSVAVPGAANLQHARKLKLMRHIAQLPVDAVVVDCGAGIHYNVVDFFINADLHLLVATAQLVSLQNAYGFLKASVYRMLRQRAAGSGKGEFFEQASDQSEVETVHKLLQHIAASDAALAGDLQAALSEVRFSLLGNQLSDAREQNALHALARMMSDFLSLKIAVEGGLLRKDRIHAAVTRRRPFMADSNDAEAQLLLQLADRFLQLQPRASMEQSIQIDVSADGGGRVDPFDRAASNTAVPLPTNLSRYERAHERHRVEWTANVETDGIRHHAHVLDISRGGVRMLLRRPCNAGARLRIAFLPPADKVTLAARVVHAAGLHVGCVFDPSPDSASLDALLARAQRDGSPIP